MADYCWVYGVIHVTCRLTACTPGSAPGPALGNEYGKTLPFSSSSGGTDGALVVMWLAVGTQMSELSDRLNYDREVIRVWFCNKRQALKNTIKKLRTQDWHWAAAAAAGPVRRCFILQFAFSSYHGQQLRTVVRSPSYIFLAGVSWAGVSCRRRWPPPTSTLALTTLLGW